MSNPIVRSASVSCTLLLSACALGGLKLPVPPVGVTTVTRPQVDAWLARNSTLVPGRQEFAFSFTYTDGTKETAPILGKGKARMAFPDSLRLDFSGPLGSYRSAAFVIGDSAPWAYPQERVEQLVPEYPLLWALLGISRPPAPGAVLRGASANGITSWEYLSGADTIRYVVRDTAPRQLSIVVRRGGKEIGRVLTTFDAGGKLVKSTLLVPSEKSTLELKFTRLTVPALFDPEVWRAPSDSL